MAIAIGRILPRDLDSMTDSLAHRGPDGRGVWICNLRSGGQLGLGHRRLSVLDLSNAGQQPMARDGLHLTFNGEIYNFKEIREALIKQGHRFSSDSDTEVILASVRQWGLKKAVGKFNGMFAFALYDSDSEKLHLVRDRAGVKPLYYTVQDQHLLFASEVKAFRKCSCFDAQIDPSSVESFFRFGYIPSDSSIYGKVQRIPPGSIVSFDLKTINRPVTEKYWDLYDFFNAPKVEKSLDESAEELDSLLHSAFKYRMVSDVPIGIFLSGGFDSTIVAAILQQQSTERLKTFTIGFDDQDFNEAPHAKDIANLLGTDHHEHICREADAMEILPDLTDHYDEPFADASAIPTLLVSRIARESVTVALSADAGDELFGGYNKYEQALSFMRTAKSLPKVLQRKALLDLILRIPIPRNIGKRSIENLAMLSGGNNTACDLLKLGSHIFRPRELASLMTGDLVEQLNLFDSEAELSFEHNGPLNRMLAMDYKTYLPDDILTKVDRATMAVSLEGREPLLDYRIAEFAATLPENYKINNGVRKVILKKVMDKYVPSKYLDRPKKGFSVPYYRWLRGDMRWLIEEHLSPEKIKNNGYVSNTFAQRYLKRFFDGDPKTNVGTWTLLMFHMWMDRWANPT